jgi:hypothetical protein
VIEGIREQLAWWLISRVMKKRSTGEETKTGNNVCNTHAHTEQRKRGIFDHLRAFDMAAPKAVYDVDGIHFITSLI